MLPTNLQLLPFGACHPCHSTAHHSAVQSQHITTRRSAAQAAQHSTAQQRHITSQRSAAQRSTTTAQCSTAQPNTAQRSTDSAAQHSTAQHHSAQQRVSHHSAAQRSTTTAMLPMRAVEIWSKSGHASGHSLVKVWGINHTAKWMWCCAAAGDSVWWGNRLSAAAAADAELRCNVHASLVFNCSQR